MFSRVFLCFFMFPNNKMTEQKFAEENESLLNFTKETEEAQKPNSNANAKRGSKTELIQKIFEVCDKNGLQCEHSTTFLKRSTKKELSQILATKIEAAMEKKLLEQVNLKNMEGASSQSNQDLLALGTLRMCHDTLSKAVEAGSNFVLPKYGMTIEGF